MHNEEILRWGLDSESEKLLNIMDVKNGISCDCICPVCKTALVAHQGNIITYHFKHDQKNKCVGAAETALHLKGKEIIAKHKKLKLPYLSAEAQLDGLYESVPVVRQKTYEFDEEVIVEEVDGNIVPDLVVSYKGKKLLIEVAVTHFVDEKKLKKIRAKGISCVEIDLSELHKRQENVSDELLLKHVIDSVDNKKWIYNAKYSMAEKNALKHLVEKKKFKEKQENYEKSERDLAIKNRVTELLGKNPRIVINIEDSEYYEPKSNRVQFEILGELHSTTHEGTKIPHQNIAFMANIDIDTDDDVVEFFGLEVENVSIERVFFENLIERELRSRSEKRLYTWLSNKATRLSRY